MSPQATLDYLAAKTAQQIVTESRRTLGVAPKDLETLLTKALGVLQAQGVYALYLFLYSRGGMKKNIEKAALFVVGQLWKALKEEPIKNLQIAHDLLFQDSRSALWETAYRNRDDLLKAVTETITADLYTLFLVRDLYEQTLIYARYHAKALGGEEK